MEKRMTLRFPHSASALAFAAALAIFTGCAGSKPSSSSMSSGESSSEGSRTSKLEDARRSAEDAEMKAHQLREEKNRTTSKTSSN
jgi:hypothetical protein